MLQHVWVTSPGATQPLRTACSAGRAGRLRTGQGSGCRVRVGVEVLQRLTVAVTDDGVRRLGADIAAGVMYLDGAGARRHTCARTVGAQASIIVDATIASHAIDPSPAARTAALTHVATSLREIEAASAQRKAHALVQLNAVLQYLEKMGPYTPWHKTAPENRSSSGPGANAPGEPSS